MEPLYSVNDAPGNQGNNAENEQSDRWVTDVFPRGDIFEPYVRPTRKNTYKPKFPPGFSPFNDKRDPEADPHAYPPPPRKPFEEFIGGTSQSIRTYGLGALSQAMLRRHARILRTLKALAFTFSALTTPIIFWVATFDLWRHYNGWLHYLFYYVAATQGYYQRQFECSRVLREGSNRRFTITKQFWFRRGCEGSFDGNATQGKLFKTISNRLAGTFITTWFCWPHNILHFVVWFLVWGLIAGLVHDFLYFIGKYAIWLLKRRVWPLLKDICDWPWLFGFFVTPWVIKAHYFWTAIWAVFLGFDIHAFRPRRVGQQQGVPVDQLNDLFGPEDEDDGEFADQGDHDIPENLQPGFVPQLDPNDVLFPAQPGLGHFAPGGGAEQDAAMDPDELFFGDGRAQQLQPHLPPFEQFEQEQGHFEEEQLPVVDVIVSDSDEEDQGIFSRYGSDSNNIPADLPRQGQALHHEPASDSSSVPADLLRDPSSEGSYRGGEDLDPERTRTDFAGWSFGHGDEGFLQGGQQQEKGWPEEGGPEEGEQGEGEKEERKHEQGEREEGEQ